MSRTPSLLLSKDAKQSAASIQFLAIVETFNTLIATLFIS